MHIARPARRHYSEQRQALGTFQAKEALPDAPVLSVAVTVTL